MEWFKCYPDRLIGALQTMGAARAYLYTMVILRIYKVGGPIDDSSEELARLTGLNTEMVDKALAWLLQKGKLRRDPDGRLMNAFAEQEIEKSKSIDIDSEIQHSLAAAESRSIQAGGLSVLTGACDDRSAVAVKPYNSDSEKKDGARKKRRSSITPKSQAVGGGISGTTGKKAKAPAWPADAFQQFWDNVPRRIGRRAAERSFDRVRKSGVTWQVFFAGVLRWKADAARKETQFVCHPTTWLNQGRWDDEPDASGPAGGGRQGGGRRSIWDRVNATMEPTNEQRPDIEIFSPGEPLPGTRHH